MEKGKLKKERLSALQTIKKYGLLTLPMAAILLREEKETLYENLETLSAYGLVIKQFYECRCDGEDLRTEGFYCAAPIQPVLESQKPGEFVWKKELRIEEAMSLLAFNQFHIALAQHVPKRAIYVRFHCLVRGIRIDGRYHLKGSRYRLGYSHMMALAVRDFTDHNKRIVDNIHKVWEYYAYGEEKVPWFVLICENKLQCATINRRIRSRPDMSDILVFYILDTDLDFRENPLLVLQKFRFAGESREIVSETYKIETWY